jgi:hypothetical protein
MLLQSLIVAVLVLGSALYALGSLLPAGVRRALALRALRWPLPAWAARRLQRASKPASGCGGCDNCGDAGGAHPGASPSLPGAAKVVTFHRRPPAPR